MKTRQHGATLIEFALVFLTFLVFFLGLIDFSRMLYTWNAADEAMRAGARFAVVCHDSTDASDAAVLARMRNVLPNIQSATINWEPDGCDQTTCQGVRVQLDGFEFDWLSPIRALAAAVAMPTFSTYLPREVMRQDPLSNDLWCTNTNTPLP